jgi:hypothetical protein
MKKIVLINLLFLFVTMFSFSLQVGVDELKVNKDIEFINYNGKHDYIETVFDIMSIGSRLAGGIKRDNVPFNYAMKYSIIHVVDNTTNDKYDAAIFFIEKDAQVDHIRNVRLIISSYLQKKFGYTKKDADTLSFFITIYNAVYRGNVDYFSTKYKAGVLKYINKNDAGISTKYYEWPGNTKILIPLTNDLKKGNLSSLNTTELTDKKVTEELRTRDDKGVPQRKDIVSLKEKEVQQKTNEIDKGTKTVEKEKQQIQKDEKKIEEKKTAIEQKKEEVVKKEAEAQKEKDTAKTPEEQKKAEQKLQEVEKQKEQIAKEEEKVKTEEKKVEAKKDEVGKQEEKIEQKKEEIAKKQEEIQKDKEEIKKDETSSKSSTSAASTTSTAATETTTAQKEAELKQKQDELDKREQSLKEGQADKNIFANKLYYLKIKNYMSDGHYNNEMYIINALNKKVELHSELQTICGHKYDVSKNGVVVIGYEGQHSSPHNLFLLDLNTLKIKIKGKDNIFWRSFVETRDDFIYAIIKIGENEYALGKFNQNLELVGKSTEKIDEDTFISFFDNFVYLNSVDKQIIVLNKDDLKLIEKIAP